MEKSSVRIGGHRPVRHSRLSARRSSHAWLQRGSHFVIIARGQERKGKTTRDRRDRFYWIFESVAFAEAIRFEAKNRIGGEDFRRPLIAPNGNHSDASIRWGNGDFASDTDQYLPRFRSAAAKLRTRASVASVQLQRTGDSTTLHAT